MLEARGEPAGPIWLGRLPAVGVAIGEQDGVVFIDTKGAVVTRLAGFELVGNAGAPGLWLRSGRSYYRMDAIAGAVEPVSTKVAKRRMYDESAAEPNLPSPPGSTGGQWRFAFTSPLGGATLAQWSGECEVPTAFWVDANGTERIVTGEKSLSDAPESFALGWSPTGEALVFLPEGACASGASRRGIYAFSAPGRGRLIYPTGEQVGTLAEAWGMSSG